MALRRSRGGSSRSRPAAASRGVYVSSAQNDVYTAMLGVALGAMVLGSLLLVWVWSRYGFQTKPTAYNPPAAVSRLA